MGDIERTPAESGVEGASVVDTDLRVALAEISTRIESLTKLVEHRIESLTRDVVRLETRVDAAWTRLDHLPQPREQEELERAVHGTARRLDRVIWTGIGLAAGGGGVAGAVSATLVQALGG